MASNKSLPLQVIKLTAGVYFPPALNQFCSICPERPNSFGKLTVRVLMRITLNPISGREGS